MSEDYLKAAVEIAREAGAILREEFDRPLQISYKGDVDLVTQADKRSEAAIVKRLTEFFPRKKARATKAPRSPSIAGMSTRWTAQRTLPTAILVFACRLGWRIATR
jgi:3'-phosphoadenosine 5'-phosphosulfate (PAPS) 3'-phosphatase